MADITPEAAPEPASSPKYRPLDRDKAEFRLLRILPSVSSRETNASLLDSSSDPIRCELQYESLDVLAARSTAKQSSTDSILAYILQDLYTSRAGDADMDTGALVDILGRRLGSHLSVDEGTAYDIGDDRIEVLKEIYEQSKQIMEVWQPEGIPINQKSFDQWLESWIWTPLSGHAKHLEHKSLGYFALSYVWRDQQRVTLGPQDREMEEMVAASGMSMREILESTDMTPEQIDQVCGPAENATDLVEITIDDMPVLIGQNLEKALRSLREIPEIQGGTRVWVDALCINQQDVEEKNIEVKRMGDIYRKAERVVSYLGDEEDLSGPILELMDAIGEVVMRAQVLAPITLNFFRSLRSDIALAMAKLLLRPYFSRIWIVQEIVLGGEKSIAICGNRRFSWTNLLRCGKMLNAGMAAASWNWDMRLDEDEGEGQDDSYLKMADLKSGITKLQMLRDAHLDVMRMEGDEGEGNQRVPRSNTLWFRIPSSNKATDSRDLIYGMLNLLPKKLTALVHVDYAEGNGFVDAMRNFAEAHIIGTQSLDWILNRYYSPFLGHKEWPTWVPNLAQPFSSAHWDWGVNLQDAACINIPCSSSFEVHHETSKRLLVCKGVKVDTVLHCTQNLVIDGVARARALAQVLVESMTVENEAQIYAMLENIQVSSRKKLSFIIPDEEEEEEEEEEERGGRERTESTPVNATTTHRYGDVEGLKAAFDKCFSRFGMTLTGGQSVFNFPLDISDEHDEVLREILESREFSAPVVMSFNSLRAVFAELDIWGSSLAELFPAHAADVDPASYSAPDIGDRGMSFAHLFTTSSGSVGTCLCNIQSGDEIFLLAGCSMPVLLKKSPTVSGTYELRGGVYIPDIMEGEALSNNGLLEENFETIMIC